MSRRIFHPLFLFAPLLAIAGDPDLPFDPGTVNRYSLNGVVRSLSVRQGDRTWLGYDLERGTVFVAWQAPENEPGFTGNFVTRSRGKEWFSDSSSESWKLFREEELVTSKLRYLSCSHREDSMELLWELRHESGAIAISEHTPTIAPEREVRAIRELHISGLQPGEALRPVSAVSEAWELVDEAGDPITEIQTSGVYRIILP